MVGKIVDNNDPKQMGRLKCRVALIHDSVPDSDLPWCNPKNQSAGKGSTDIPSIGEDVFIEFPDGDYHEPMYAGNVQTAHNLNSSFRTNYPNRKGYASEHGFIFYRDESNGDVHFEAPAGLTIDINGSSVTIVSATRLTVNIGGMSCVISGAGINITGGDVVADGISLKTHIHGGVMSGGSTTGQPV
jgi:phage baseplate assembly protein gpV